MNRNYLYELTYELNAAALEVHKFFGSALMESTYQVCLEQEFKLRGINYEMELTIPIDYKGLSVNAHLRCDFFIEKCIVVELKTVSAFIPAHQAQLLTYMELLKAPKGILYNFHADNLLRQGQKTFVNKWYPAQ